jgi:hypothetical protein
LALPPDPASPLTVRTLDASGKVLADAGARIEPLHLDGAAGAASFAVSIPAGAAAVELVSGATIVDRRVRTQPPSVRVLAPKSGERAGRSLVVRWSASDPDRDPLQVVVDYSADGGTRWRTVFQGPSTGRTTVPGRFLQASNHARVRVSVDDGFNRARDQSAAFTAAGSAPTAQITSPRAGDALQSGTTLLEGSALDDSEHRLRAASLTWFAGPRRLGTGERLLATLPAGTIVLCLRARDHRGRVATVVRRLRIAPVALAIRALQAPQHVSRGTGQMTLRLATSTPAVLRIGRRSYDVGPRAGTLRVALPALPAVGVLRLKLTITARGPRQPALRETVIVLRA